MLIIAMAPSIDTAIDSVAMFPFLNKPHLN